MKLKLISFYLLCFLTACHPVKTTVQATVETAPVESSDDAADDPAIFIHPTNAEKNAIIGTNKQSGLVVYNLKGEQIHQYPVGRVNNVDIRQNFSMSNGEKITIVGASNRTDNTIGLYRLSEETLELADIAATKITSSVNEVYGFCFYQNSKTYAIVVGKDGQLEQWELKGENSGKVSARLVRSIKVGGQCEGLVADDEKKILYVAEEGVGIWKYSAIPDSKEKRTFIDGVKTNRNLKADLEGLTIYHASNGKGYLIASSQGNNSYAVYERENNNKYLGSFRITDSNSIDGTSDTDGIDVINLQASAQFPNGFFIVQDGFNKSANKKKQNQNFKLVPWERIANAFSKPLIIDRDYSIKH